MIGKDIIVTIPASTPLQQIRDEILTIGRGVDNRGNHKIGRYKPRLNPINILFIYKGKIRYVAKFKGFDDKAFKCTTTGKQWDKAWYATFNNVREIPAKQQQDMQGTQGFRYIDHK
jgi:hypothetical protein